VAVGKVVVLGVCQAVVQLVRDMLGAPMGVAVRITVVLVAVALVPKVPVELVLVLGSAEAEFNLV
jgi:hypothetical protein